MPHSDAREHAVASFLARKTGIGEPRIAIRDLVNKTLLAAGPQTQVELPVDLAHLSAVLHVQPPTKNPHLTADAVLVPERDGFSLILKVGDGVSLARQRSSWAHEICHTYFYEQR